MGNYIVAAKTFKKINKLCSIYKNFTIFYNASLHIQGTSFAVLLAYILKANPVVHWMKEKCYVKLTLICSSKPTTHPLHRASSRCF